MLFVAHQTVDLSGMFAVTKAKMGNTVHHNMHNVVKLFLSMSQKEMERDNTHTITSQRAVWTIEKTKQIPTIGAQGYYYVLPQEGKIDTDRELVDIAVEMDIIQRRGAWYSYGTEKWNGMTAIDLSEKVRSEIATLILGREFEEV
jgi:hypothetical protein